MEPRALDIYPNPKQYLAYQALANPDIAEIHYGGAAGGGKSWLGAESRLMRAIAYPGYKSFIGRNELKRLMATSFITWTKVCKFHNVDPSLWRLNGQYNYIELWNGSRIDLLDLSFKPSDPMYERLGSLEYTDGWIDEAGEVPFMAVDILQSRIGRHNDFEVQNPETGQLERITAKPDTLYTYNPNKGWVYRVFKQHRDGVLPPDVVFIQAFFDDNPHTKDLYGKQLDRIKDPAMRARLKLGSFDYDADPAQLISSEAAVDLFTNTVPESEWKGMSIDVARHGVDKTVIYLWRGMRITGVRIYQKQDTAQTALKAKTEAKDKAIPYSQIIADEDGIGGGVVDQMKGVQGFIANSPALENPETEEKENYASLKAQCSYVLAEKVNRHELAIDTTFPDGFVSEVPGIGQEVWKDMLIEELEHIKSKHSNADTKLRVLSKEETKESLGRSPDFADTMMMRMRLLYPSTLKVRGATVYRPQYKGFNRRG